MGRTSGNHRSADAAFADKPGSYGSKATTHQRLRKTLWELACRR